MPEVEIALEKGTERQGTCVKLRGTRVLFGRTKRCSIRLTDETASREHAALMLDEGVWYVRDLGSSNGTFVNGYAVRSIALHLGDEVRFGEAGAQVRILGLVPSLPDDEIPVLEPLAGPPTVAGLRRGRCWLGAVALGLIAAALVLTGLMSDRALRPVARAASPREMFEVVTRAVRERHHESIFDVLSVRARRQAEEAMAGADASPIEVREAILRAGRAGDRPGIDWRILVRVDLETDGLAGTLVTEGLGGEEATNRIVLEDGSWRLDEPVFGLGDLPLKSPDAPAR